MNNQGIARFQTIKQCASSGIGLSEAAIRWHVFNSKTNGLDTAIIRIGRKVLLDIEAFQAWIENHRVQKEGN